jgi:hypothetical protein
MPDRMPEGMPEKVPECLPDRRPESLPDRMPETKSETMPEDLPVTKCINVMVGITRSEVILCVLGIGPGILSSERPQVHYSCVFLDILSG